MVGLVDYIQQIGNPRGPGIVAEIEADHAQRSVMRSNEYDHGAYSVSFSGRGISGGSATIAPVSNYLLAGLQWISTKNYMLVKKIVGTIYQWNCGSNLGILRLFVKRAQSFTRQFDTYGFAGSPTIPGINFAPIGSGNKHLNTMINSDNSGLVMSSWPVTTPAIGNSENAVPGPSLVYAANPNVGDGAGSLYPTAMRGGQYVVDALPIGAVVTSAIAGASPARLLPPQVLVDMDIGPPLILENFSGLVFAMDAPGDNFSAAIFQYSINVQWDEVSSYTLGANT